MRRLFSILLLVVLAFTPVAPAFAQMEGANVPLCCRGNGAHKCMRMAGMAGAPAAESATPQFAKLRARCPYSPASVVSLHAEPLGQPKRVVSLMPVACRPAGVPQTEARGRIALERCHGKRGPPSNLS